MIRIERGLAGVDVILEIDWQGARQVRSIFTDALGVFIVPPSLAELRRRLTGRGQDAAEVIEQRMDEARAELSHWQEFDYVVVNDDFAQALDALRAVFVANRQRRAEEVPVADYVALARSVGGRG
jgi:guanylate kinase